MTPEQERKLSEVHYMLSRILSRWDALANESQRHGTAIEDMVRDNRARDARILELADRIAALESGRE